MEPVTMALLGGGLMAGGAASTYFGGKNEAKRKKNAINAYDRESKRLYEAMTTDAWNQGLERQRGTGQVIRGLTPTMSAGPSSVPQVADSLPTAAPTGDADYDAVMQRVLAPKVQRAQLGANVTQAGMDREALARALDALGYSSTLEAQAQAPAHVRFQWQRQQELAEARRRLEEVLGTTSNKTRNLQLLGSILTTAGQMGMMAAPYMGGGPPAGTTATFNANQNARVNAFNAAARGPG